MILEICNNTDRTAIDTTTIDNNNFSCQRNTNNVLKFIHNRDSAMEMN